MLRSFLLVPEELLLSELLDGTESEADADADADASEVDVGVEEAEPPSVLVESPPVGVEDASPDFVTITDTTWVVPPCAWVDVITTVVD